MQYTPKAVLIDSHTICDSHKLYGCCARSKNKNAGSSLSSLHAIPAYDTSIYSNSIFTA